MEQNQPHLDKNEGRQELIARKLFTPLVGKFDLNPDHAVSLRLPPRGTDPELDAFEDKLDEIEAWHRKSESLRDLRSSE